MFSVFGLENPLMDIIARVDGGFLDRHAKRPGSMHLVEYEEIHHLLAEVSSTRRMPGGSAANTVRGIAALTRNGGAGEGGSTGALARRVPGRTRMSSPWSASEIAVESLSPEVDRHAIRDHLNLGEASS